MRYFDFTIVPDGGQIHPADSLIAEDSDVTREALTYLNALVDGTGVLLYRLSGDPSSLSETLEESDEVIEWQLLDGSDDAPDIHHLYLHVPPGDPIHTLLMLAQKYALIIETPLTFTERGGLRTTMVGTHETLRKVLEETPDDVTFSVEQAGQYAPNNRDVVSRLTDRQYEVFETAVDLGYYEVPRRATHDDIADTLGCAASTVDEHLRKAEANLLSALVD